MTFPFTVSGGPSADGPYRDCILARRKGTVFPTPCGKIELNQYILKIYIFVSVLRNFSEGLFFRFVTYFAVVSTNH